LITTSFYDPAARDGKQHDYKAIVLGSLLPNGIYYVRYAYIRKTSVDQVLEKAYALDAEYDDLYFGFETNGFQVLYETLLQYKAKEKGYSLNIYKETSVSNKGSRIESLSGLIENGIIRFKKKNLTEYYSDITLLAEQLLEFPNGEHDDGPDALYYAYKMAKNKAMRAAYGSSKNKPPKPQRKGRDRLNAPRFIRQPLR
jgi:predicted phage terminase large subunit-like protein